MNRVSWLLLGAWLVWGWETAQAQNMVPYPPATGVPQSLPRFQANPGNFGGAYSEVPLPQGNWWEFDPALLHPVPTPAPEPQVIPRPVPRRNRGARVYTRGYNQAPAPYSTPLPRGQLIWPGADYAPQYTPELRYQNYGSAYGRGPYGSGFYPGYFRGFPMGPALGY